MGTILVYLIGLYVMTVGLRQCNADHDAARRIDEGEY